MDKKEPEVYYDTIELSNESKKKSVYDIPDVVNYIIKRKNDGVNFNTITDELRLRGYPDIPYNTVRYLWGKVLKKTVVHSTTAKENYEQYTSDLVKLYGRSINVMTDLLSNIENINKALKNRVSDDSMDAEDVFRLRMTLTKISPFVTSILREIREANKFQADLQDKTTTEESKSMGVDEMSTLLDEHKDEILQMWLPELEQKGKIKILN